MNDEGSLAGAHTTQAEGVKRLVERIGLTPEESLRMAITVPGQAMGLQLDRVEGRSASDMICLEDDLTYSRPLADLLSHKDA